MFTIRQNGDRFEVLRDGVVVRSETSRDIALRALTDLARAELATSAGQLATAPGRLDAGWRSGPNGIVLAADTGDGRDFSGCTFTWRDPDVSLLPLMLQTTTDVAHYGAVLAGWMETLAARGDGGVDSTGWFYDSDAGRQAHDMLGASGRFGVSVDPGAVDYEDVCDVMDDEGFWCLEGHTTFIAYEIIGLTMTPFPAFATAYIELDTSAATASSDDEPADETDPAEDDENDAADAAAAVLAAATVELVRASVLRYPEPPDDDARYVDQGEGRIAIPLTITDDGHVYGHAAVAGTCHIGYRDECVTPPPSPSGYAQFHLGSTPTDEGPMSTGVLVLNCDHAGRGEFAAGARDHYAHTGLAWADVHASDGRHGVWITGQLRAGVTPELRRVLMASTLSGDWRPFGAELDMVAIQSVNVPGFPVRRQVLAAAGGIVIAEPSLRVRHRDGHVVEMAGAGIVRPARVRTESLTAAGTVDCGPCARAGRGRQTTTGMDAATGGLDRKLDAIIDRLGLLERRTRHLVRAEMASVAEQLSR